MLGYTKEDQDRVGYPEGTVFREESVWKDLWIPMLIILPTMGISLWLFLMWVLVWRISG